MGLATGCFDPPPEYSVPIQVPPVVDTASVVPPTTGVTTVTAGVDTLTFTVPFRADDGGEEMLAYFVEDIPTTTDPGAVLAQPVHIPPDPRPFSEQKRSVVWPWAVPKLDSKSDPTGCHTVTMILSLKSNFTGLYGTTDELATARVTWFLDIRDPNAVSTTSTCGPYPGTVTP
jgi:hypothetical protein